VNKTSPQAFSLIVFLLLVALCSTGCKEEATAPSGEEAIQNAENRDGAASRSGNTLWPEEPIDGSNVATEFVRFEKTGAGLHRAQLRIFNYSDKKVDKLVMKLRCVDQSKKCAGGAADGANCETNEDCPKSKKGKAGICQERTLPCPGGGDTHEEWWTTGPLAIPGQSHNLYMIGLELSKQIARVDTTIKEVIYTDQSLWAAESE